MTASLTGNESWPDLLVVPFSNAPFFVELKVDKKGRYKERPLQKIMRERLTAMGHRSVVIDSKDDWEKILDESCPTLH